MSELRTGTTRPVRSGLVRLALVAAIGFGLVGGSTPVAVALPMSQALAGGTAVISGGGDGVHLRAEATFGSEVLAVIPDGVTVDLRISQIDTVLDPDGQTRWWPVAVDGVDGWVTGYYLSDNPAAADPVPGTTSTGDPAVEPAVAEPTVDESTSRANPSASTARVADPDGLNVRVDPDANADVVALVAAGMPVTLRTDEIAIVYDAEDRAWWPVEINGELGWVVGAYLTSGADESAGTSFSEGAAATFAAGQYVREIDGDGVNIRVEASVMADRVGFVSPGDVVQVMSGPASFEASGNGWYLITTGDVTGYINGDFFVLAEQRAAPEGAPTEPEAPRDAARFTVGQIVQAATGDGDGLNLRSDIGADSTVWGKIAEFTAVEVLDGPYYDASGNGWYYVTSGDTEGFASGRFLVATDLDALPVADTAPVAEARTEVPAPDADARMRAEEFTPEPVVEDEPVRDVPEPPTAGVATGGFIYPTTGNISQLYGCSPFPFYPYDANLGCGFHNGLDIATASYTPIISSDGGIVTYAGWCDCGLGFYVEIDHGNGYSTVYGHMAEMPYVVTGQAVNQGDLIGPIGSTGFSTGPHIHFMVKLNGNTIDPLSVLG